MRTEIRDGSGNIIGWKDKDSSGTTHVYDKHGTYKGYSNDTGTYSGSGSFKFQGDNAVLLLND